MKYTDLNDKPVTREQFIEIGLSRGELVIKEECGCVVIQDRTADAYIVYCDKHAATAETYEALKAVMEVWGQPAFNSSTALYHMVVTALAKAEKGA